MYERLRNGSERSQTGRKSCWEYHLEKYTKEEYIKMINEQNQKTQADLEYLAMMTEVELE